MSLMLQCMPMVADRISPRIVPSKSAAIALLLVDVLACLGSVVFSRSGSWFVVCYVPILATVALGLMMSGYGSLIGLLAKLSGLLLSASMLLLVRLLSLQKINLEQLSFIFKAGWWVFGLLALILAVFAIAGWVRFFTGNLILTEETAITE